MNHDEMLTKLATELAEWPRAPKPYGPPEEVYDKYLPWKWWLSHEDDWLVLRRHGEMITRQDWLNERARLINKPSWDDAPEYAEWLAQDRDGVWFWYSEMPKAKKTQWEGKSVIAGIQGALPAGHDWRFTLEQRPVLEAHTEPEWDGESWPPPINMMCEYRYSENSEWRQGTCVGYYNGYAVVVDEEDDDGTRIQMVEHVRPLRTAEQREAEALAQKISDFFSSHVPEEYLCLARELIRDGYRKVEEPQ